MQKFKIVCNNCGDENVEIWNYESTNGDHGIKFKCSKCGQSEKKWRMK